MGIIPFLENLSQWKNTTTITLGWHWKVQFQPFFTSVVLTRSSNHPEYKAHVLVLNSAHWQILIAVTHEPEPNSSKSYHPTFDFFTGPLSTVPPLLLTLTQLILIHATQTPLHFAFSLGPLTPRSNIVVVVVVCKNDLNQLSSSINHYRTIGKYFLKADVTKPLI